MLKQIYLKENLAPPSLDAIRAAYSSLLAQVANPQALGNLVRSGELGRVGIYGLQAYGIFKVRWRDFFDFPLAVARVPCILSVRTGPP